MNSRKCKLQIVGACLVALCAELASAAPFNFDDIEFWVGSGANRAAIVIDWDDSSEATPALAWGFRWDGEAFGNDMLVAIVSADDRLFAKLAGPPDNPLAVYGIGYDADEDGEFGVDDGTSFDDAGIALTGPSDLGMATDPGDQYAEGWFAGFWHYGVAATSPYDGGSWSDTPLGVYARPLTDGAWDSWTFTPTFSFASFAVNPQAAPSPYPPGDFDHDGAVTSADYDVWKSSFGSTTELTADANKNGIIDAADYVVWRNRLTVEPSSSFAVTVPEPSCCVAAVGALLSVLCFQVRAWRLTPLVAPRRRA